MQAILFVHDPAMKGAPRASLANRRGALLSRAEGGFVRRSSRPGLRGGPRGSSKTTLRRGSCAAAIKEGQRPAGRASRTGLSFAGPGAPASGSSVPPFVSVSGSKSFRRRGPFVEGAIAIHRHPPLKRGRVLAAPHSVSAGSLTRASSRHARTGRLETLTQSETPCRSTRLGGRAA